MGSDDRTTARAAGFPTVLRRRLRRYLPQVAGLVFFSIALWFIHRELRGHPLNEVLGGLALPTGAVLTALALTALTFLLLTGYDLLALYYIRRPLPYRRVALASFTGFSFSHSLGFPLLTGGPVRYRMYSAWGLTPVEISQVVLFYTVTFWIGVAGLAGVVFLVEPGRLAEILPGGEAAVRLGGAACLLTVGAYLGWALLRRRPFTLRGWTLAAPPARIAVAQAGLAMLEWALAASVLYVLLPPMPELELFSFLGIFLVAQTAGLLSGVPGGLGVLEAMLLLLLPSEASAGALVGSFLAYRGIFYLLPLCVGTGTLLVHEMERIRERMVRLGRSIGGWTARLAPPVLAAVTFLGGAILLFTGATPSRPGRLAWLNSFLPLPVIEASHFLASVVGAGLLVLAWGIARRMDAAWHVAAGLLGAGILLSLGRGADWEAALALASMLALLLPARRHFHRRTSFLEDRFAPPWIAATGLALLGFLSLGLFSYRHLAYQEELWWQFALRADAPRFLRAAVGASAVVLAVGLVRLLRPAPPRPTRPGAAELARAAEVVAASPRASASLALAGDKELLFSGTGRTLLMYGIEGRSWVALGDPVGPEEEWEEVGWRFRELVDGYDGHTVFYQVSRSRLDLYVELGLSLLKVGESARVPLEDFSLEGRERKAFRSALRRLEGEGYTFEVAPVEAVSGLLPELREISDAWLASKGSREKGFSLGFFEEAYLRHFPAALVRRGGEIVAFANVWRGAGAEEISPDLIRYRPTAPNGVMDFLLLQLIGWGRQEGYRWLSLGMAPLAGLETRRLAPVWNRFGALVFRLGDHFYSFQGLRQYKEKFDPEWEPRYLAVPGGLAIPRILANVAALISGGVRRVFTR